MVLRGVADALLERRRFVLDNAEVGDRRAEPLQHADEEIAVGVVGRSVGPRRAGLDDLVAGREQCNAHAAADLQFRKTDTGGERDVLRRKAAACGKNDRAFLDVLAGEAAVRSELEPGRQDHLIAVGLHVLLHEDGVGARRHRRAGEDADGLVRFDRTRRGLAGGEAAHDRELVSPPAARSRWRTA